MSKTKESAHRRTEANMADPSQIPGYDARPARRDGGRGRYMSKGYQPVRSYQIPADRHE